MVLLLNAFSRSAGRLAGDAGGLQKLVGVISGLASLIGACINFLTLCFDLSAAPSSALSNPSVVLLLAGGGAWIATGLIRGPFFQGVQIVLFYLSAIAIAQTSHPGNVTSALFLMYAGILMTEYFPHRRAVRWIMVPSAAFYAAALSVGVAHYAHGFVAVTVSSLIVVATGSGLYGVVLLRHWHKHRREAELLEERVKERTAELEGALGERVVMLQEIHHRVKNNLQIVASLLRLEVNKVEDETMRRPMETSIERIHAMALVHETLYQSEGLQQVDLSRYTHDLVAAISGSMGSIIIFEPKNGPPINVDLDFAVPFGLLLNELVTNAVEHAYPTGAKGVIRVFLERDREIRLVVEDDGVGLPSNPGDGTQQHLGLTIVHSLVAQLHGEIHSEHATGTRWRAVFPTPRSAGG